MTSAETLVRENDDARFYKDSVCCTLEQKLHWLDKYGLSLPGYFCLLVEDKSDGSRFYAIYDDRHTPLCAFDTEMEGEGCIAAIKYRLRNDLDILTIAETGKIPRA